MSCPHCQAEVGDSDRFCKACGTALPRPEAMAPIPATLPPRTQDPEPSIPGLPTGALSTAPAAGIALDLGELSFDEGRPRRAMGRVAALVAVYLVLFAASAMGTYQVMVNRIVPTQATLTLGSPRLLRGGEATPTTAPSEAPDAARSEPAAHPSVRPRPARPAGPTQGARSPEAPASPSTPPVTEPAPSGSDTGDHEDTPPPASPAPDEPSSPVSKKEPASEPKAGPASEPKAGPAKESTAEDRREAYRASLNIESVRMVITHYLPQIRACHERASKQGELIGGIVEIQFTVTESGAVGNTVVHRDTSGSETLASCIASTLKRWRFPKPAGGEMEFIYPFVFSSGG